MNTWPDDRRRALLPSDHDRWNANNYPGTYQLCSECDEPTERCVEDSFFRENGDGPLCETCYDKEPHQ